MKYGKTIVTVLSAAALSLFAAACSSGGGNSGQSTENQVSQQAITQYEQAQPAPLFKYSVMRQAAIAVEASQALGEQTTSFFFHLGASAPFFSCPSIGDPIPNTAELTNPSKVETVTTPYQGGAAVTIGNIDPNGIYAPAASQGTNVMCINGQGQQYLVYSEDNVTTVNGAAHWDSANNQIVVTGQPTMPKCQVTDAGSKAQTVCTK